MPESLYFPRSLYETANLEQRLKGLLQTAGLKASVYASCNRFQSVKKWLLFQKNLKRSFAPLTGMRESCKLARVYNEKKRVLFPPCDDGGLKEVLRLATYCLEAFVVIDRDTQTFWNGTGLEHLQPIPLFPV
jgi:hypothetical protein